MPHSDLNVRRQYMHDYRQRNKNRVNELARIRYANNPTAQLANNSRWAKEHPQQQYKRTKRWRDNNPQRTQFLARRWATTNRDAVCAIQHARRARVLGNGGRYTAGEWVFLKRQYNYHCLCCGRREPAIVLTADHVLPISRGGSSFIENIQPLCITCNKIKHVKFIDYRPQITTL